ncbi:MAG: hypothetical protein D6719_12380 [Candidatus Dadabacteria bacterium]|nr:MAG: hypothetical protein D6719_12380 [Candidatus Dadabacteria bacterium]
MFGCGPGNEAGRDKSGGRSNDNPQTPDTTAQNDNSLNTEAGMKEALRAQDGKSPVGPENEPQRDADDNPRMNWEGGSEREPSDREKREFMQGLYKQFLATRAEAEAQARRNARERKRKTEEALKPSILDSISEYALLGMGILIATNNVLAGAFGGGPITVGTVVVTVISAGVGGFFGITLWNKIKSDLNNRSTDA